MRIFENKKLGNVSTLLIGILYIATTIWGYYSTIPANEYIHLSEWCCVSGAAGGAFYIFSFFYQQLKGKKINAVIYLDITLVLNLILIATVVIQLNLNSAFWFLHLINPVLVLAHFFLFCDCREIRHSKILFTSIIFPVCYIAFIAFVYRISGVAPFPADMILTQAKVGISLGLIAGLCVCFGFNHGISFLWGKQGHT